MKEIGKLLLLPLCIALLAAWQLSAQTGSEPPNTSVNGIAAKSNLADSLSLPEVAEDSLAYVADSIAYNHEQEQIYLYGNTTVKYQTATIMADSLQVDLQKERAFSMGRTVMIDKDQILIGKQVYYDVNSQTGLMRDGASNLEKGFYYGGELRKVADDIYDVDDGRYTTCDDIMPDFWFWSKQMRIYRGDKIVGKPVIVYVNNFPVFYFPFVTFSIRRGRHPGFLIPEPGYNKVDGKYVRNIAWFFPYRDYADGTVSFDLMERTGWRLNLDTRYIKRYLYNGSFNMAYQRQISETVTNNDYSIRGNHHHELGERATFDLNLDYVSNKRIWESSTDIDQSLAQRVTSSMSYRQPVRSTYINLGATYTEDLVNNTAGISLPSGSFSLPTRPVYELFVGKDKAPLTTRWWSNFNYSYYFRLDHTGFLKEKERSFADIIWDNTRDSLGFFINEHHLGAKHNLGLNYNWKLWNWLNLTQGFNYGEAWMDRDKQDHKWVRGYDYSTTTSANFTLFGIRNFPGFYVSTVRHIITPSTGFTWNPGFPDNQKFYGFGGISLYSGQKARYISLGLDQRWQIKLKATESEKERKINDIFSWTTRSSINLEKDKKQVSDLQHNLSFRPAELELNVIKLGYSTSYNFGQNPYDLHWLDWQFKNQYLTQTVSIGGRAKYRDYFPRRKNEMFQSYLPQVDTLMIEAITPQETVVPSDWSLAISHDLSANKDIFETRNNNLRMDAAFRVTQNWRVSYSNYYNLKEEKMLSQSFNISRDLHCWKLTIAYNRRSDYWDYRVVFFNTALPDALRFQTRDIKRF